MWQRYNQTSHIFEKSVDNGATWAPLPLNASSITEGIIPATRLPSTIAYTDVQNTFTSPLLKISAGHPSLGFYNTVATTDTRYCKFQAQDGNLILYMLNDGDTAVQNIPITAYRDGHVSIGTDLRAINLYEKGRPNPLGQYIDFTPTLTADSGTVSVSSNFSTAYALIGNVMIICCYWNISVSTNTTTIYLVIPDGFTTKKHSVVSCIAYWNVDNGETGNGLIQSGTGENRLFLQRTVSGTGWSAGSYYFGFTFALFI